MLGDALLAPGHLPVTDVAIGPRGMEPMPPAGGAAATRVKLYLRPILSRQSGFCQRTIATVYLGSPRSSETATDQGSRTAGLTTETAYQWIGEGKDVAACAVSKYPLFIPKLEEAQRALEAVRLLARASEATKRGSRPKFPLSIEDKEGPEMLAYLRDHPEQIPLPDWRVITDANAALASLPTDAITFAGSATTASPNILQPSDFPDGRASPQQGTTIFLGGDWTAGLVIVEGRIVRMRLMRAIPPPF